jgi:tetratricopeptide (TPR) repeat protein
MGRSWQGILLSAAAASLLSAAMLAGWIWTELLPRGGVVALWSGVGALWLGASATTLWGMRVRPTTTRGDLEQSYREALEHYLGRRWTDAEDCLRQILRRSPEDCDALMQLASLYRRQGRGAESAKLLRACQRRDVAGKWNWEIARESQRRAVG